MYNPTKPTKNKVLELIKNTWRTPFIDIKENTYAVFRKKYKNSFEVDHTDGIGTKGYYHWKRRSFKNAVIDSLAMNLNDLAIVRATPYKLQNHIVLPKDDDRAVLKIITELVKECKKRKIAVTGGETSIQNTSRGLDIGITMSGFIDKPIKNQFKKGDILIGLKSNGLHSNGFTKVRELFGDKYKKEFTQSTKIYFDEIKKISKYINGMMNITGGAFTKLKDLLKGIDVLISRNHKLNPQRIYLDIYKKGVSDKEMYKTFNCGIGFIFSVSKTNATKVLRLINGEIIGQVVKGSGKVIIDSKFSNKKLTY